MIFDNLKANMNSNDAQSLDKIKDMFDVSKFNPLALTKLPFSAISRFGAVVSELGAFLTDRVKSNSTIALDEVVDILAKHFGDDIKDIDFANLKTSDLIKLAKIIDIDYDIIKQFLKGE